MTTEYDKQVDQPYVTVYQRETDQERFRKSDQISSYDKISDGTNSAGMSDPFLFRISSSDKLMSQFREIKKQASIEGEVLEIIDDFARVRFQATDKPFERLMSIDTLSGFDLAYEGARIILQVTDYGKDGRLTVIKPSATPPFWITENEETKTMYHELQKIRLSKKNGTEHHSI